MRTWRALDAYRWEAGSAWGDAVAGGSPVPRAASPLTAVPDGGKDAALLTVDGLEVAFGGRQVVKGVSFTLKPGQCLAIVGESGSGKSVMARALLGLAGRDAVVRAQALQYRGQDLLTQSAAQWRALRGRGIGLVLQDALGSLDPLKTIGQEVSEPIRMHQAMSAAACRARVLALLDSVGIDDAALRARQYPHQLSGGLRQRALIASALAGDPDLLIADEPTTALDVTIQAQILELLRQRVKRQGKSLLLISHDLAVVSKLADEIMVVRLGQVVEQGPARLILTAPAQDYTRSLLDAIPSSDSRGRRLSDGAAAVVRVLPAAVQAVRAAHADTSARTRALALEARQVSRTYALPDGGTRTAVADVSFRLHQGETLGIVGESGSGKSTLAQLVLGLLPVSSGDVLLDGLPWSALEERRRRPLRHRIQAIYQDPLGSFDPRYRVQDIIDEAVRQVDPSPLAQRQQRIVALLASVGLDADVLHRRPSQLSGGQRQRVAISRALATNPDILVCDEPVSALDASVQAQVLDLLADLKRHTGISMLFISHDLGVIQHLCDAVLVMQHGIVVEQGETQALFQAPRHPYTQALLKAIPRIAFPD